MKKITFIYPKMVMGGAEKVLIRLVQNIDKSKYEVNVILLKHGGELEHEFPSDVEVTYAEPITLKNCLKKFKIIDFLKGIYYRIRIRTAKTFEEESLWTAKTLKIPRSISEDCVVCFSHYNYMSIWLTSQSNAAHKILWVHLTFRENRNQELYEKALEKFEKVFCVSKASKDNFDSCFPKYADRSAVLYNLIDKEEIIKNSLCEPDETLLKPAIVTVARLSPEKGQLLIPEIVRKLSDDGYGIHWYLIGDGELRDELVRLIEKHRVEDRVILLGNKQNPFPYMRKCDIYVQPSYAEGYCTTTNEARMLQKPVITTDLACMREQFTSSENGLLVEPSVDSFVSAIKFLLDNPKECQKYSDNLAKIIIDNDTELKKLYDCIE